MSPDSGTPGGTPRDRSRGLESLLWLAAGAAGAIVALKAWSATRKAGARRRTFIISDRLLEEVFPNHHPNGHRT
jgi:hypothetical protein